MLGTVDAENPRMIQTLGEDLLARDANGRLRTRIATVFPHTRTIVTVPGIHATQRMAYVDLMNGQRLTAGEPPLTDDEQESLWMTAVDLVVDDDTILIRPDPADMELAFEADEMLQQVVSKKRIKFLHVLDPQVRDAIKRRGERWRISPLPRSPEEMQGMIASSKIGIGGREIYYYNKTTGARILTYQEFAGLASLPDDQLRAQLQEIGHNCTKCNSVGAPEVEFFMSDDKGLPAALNQDWLITGDAARLRAGYESVRARFRESVPREFQADDLRNAQWRSRMYAALIGHTDQEVSEESLLGLSAEFFMQVEWLPAGRIEEGELLLDSVFEEEAEDPNGSTGQRIGDERARGFIFNFIREYGDLEYFNIARVASSLSNREAAAGRRAVYLAELKQRGVAHPVLRIMRMQKWGVCEHLDEGKDLLTSVLESEEYTEYILDRRLGCRQLGMNLTPRTTARKVGERYAGSNGRHYGARVWSTYFERDYVSGLATDKIAACRYGDDAFAFRFARVLGRAAAPNLIVGRADVSGQVLFDCGDELVIEDANLLPIDIVVADHTGTFGDYRSDLRALLPAYAAAVNRRVPSLNNPRAFADAFLDAFTERFAQVRREYVKRRRAFDTLFKHLRRDEGGSFGYRWERVLQRLDSSDPYKLADGIRQQLVLP